LKQQNSKHASKQPKQQQHKSQQRHKTQRHEKTTATSHPVLLLHTGKVSRKVLHILSSAGFTPIKVDDIGVDSGGGGNKKAMASGRFASCFEKWYEYLVKVRLWGLVGFDAVCYLDTDMLLRRNIDHLFHLLLDLRETQRASGTLSELRTDLRTDLRTELLAVPDCSHVCCQDDHRPERCGTTAEHADDDDAATTSSGHTCEGCCVWFSRYRRQDTGGIKCPFDKYPELLDFDLDSTAFNMQAKTTKRPKRLDPLESLSHRVYFNSGLMVLRPSLRTMKKLVESLASPHCRDYGSCSDQDHLNHFFRGRWRCLPLSYNAQVSASSYHPNAWDVHDVSVLHFVGSQKPWNLRKLVAIQRAANRIDVLPVVYANLYPEWWKVWESAFPRDKTEAEIEAKDCIFLMDTIRKRLKSLILAAKQRPYEFLQLLGDDSASHLTHALKTQLAISLAHNVWVSWAFGVCHDTQATELKRIIRRWNVDLPSGIKNQNIVRYRRERCHLLNFDNLRKAN
jgi:alpha-N-acetylglucosamine transferase